MKKKAAFFGNWEENIKNVYGQGRAEVIAAMTDLYPKVISSNNFDEHVVDLRDMEVVFSTWGMPNLTVEQLDQLRNMKVLFYGAGSVKGFALPYLERGIKIVSAWGANAISVAEFTLGQILLSCKGYFRNTWDCRDPERRLSGNVYRGNGVFNEKIALIGYGMVARKVREFLQAFELDIMVVDPFLEPQEAERHQVIKVSLSEAFKEAYVVSNHLPNIPSTAGLLNEELFRSMRQGATFINTGRGAQVKENDLIRVLAERPDLTALLDVTSPEPPAPDSALYKLPNVQLSSHIAGAMNNEVVRLADCMIEEFRRWEASEPLKYQVSMKMLETMA